MSVKEYADTKELYCVRSDIPHASKEHIALLDAFRAFDQIVELEIAHDLLKRLINLELSYSETDAPLKPHRPRHEDPSSTETNEYAINALQLYEFPFNIPMKSPVGQRCKQLILAAVELSRYLRTDSAQLYVKAIVVEQCEVYYWG